MGNNKSAVILLNLYLLSLLSSVQQDLRIQASPGNCNSYPLLCHLSGGDFEATMNCLLQGPTLNSLLTLCKQQMDEKCPKKLHIDSTDLWFDGIAYYKSSAIDLTKSIRVVLDGQPAIDTGGVRRQFFNDVFEKFASNQHVYLFDGPIDSVRPVYSAEARSSGLFRILGKMIGHS